MNQKLLECDSRANVFPLDERFCKKTLYYFASKISCGWRGAQEVGAGGLTTVSCLTWKTCGSISILQLKLFTI